MVQGVNNPSTWASLLHNLVLFNLHAIFLQHTYLIITSWGEKTIDHESWGGGDFGGFISNNLDKTNLGSLNLDLVFE